MPCSETQFLPEGYLPGLISSSNMKKVELRFSTPILYRLYSHDRFLISPGNWVLSESVLYREENDTSAAGPCMLCGTDVKWLTRKRLLARWYEFCIQLYNLLCGLGESLNFIICTTVSHRVVLRAKWMT